MVQVTFPAAAGSFLVHTTGSPQLDTMSWSAVGTASGPSNGVVPYVPLTAAAASFTAYRSNLSSLSFVEQKHPIFTLGTDSKTSSWVTDPVDVASVTYYVPYRLPETIAYDVLSEIVAVIATRATIPGSSSQSSTMTTTPVPDGTPPTSDSHKPSDNPASATSTGKGESSSSSGTGTEAKSSTTTTVFANTDSQIRGGAIGGTIGGLIVGAFGVLLGIWFLKRRRSGTPRKSSSRIEMGGRVTTSDNAPLNKETQVFGTAASNTGWQKHLPQEKDDKTLSRTIKAIFDQVQMYIEDYYNDRPGNIDHSAIAVLRRVSPAGLTSMLISSSNCTPILEAILVRWIVHRISLRSDAGDSFLPFEYTRIPEQNGWHMESDDEDTGHVRESKKGFPQAFSQWRILTVFLHSDPRADRDYKKQLDVKIDHGVRALIDAFSPWEKHNRSMGNRNEGLRSILQAANEAGVLLFAQPSTFVFDWSTREGTITVSPSLVKRLDEFGNPLAKPDTLIAAKRSNVV